MPALPGIFKAGWLAQTPPWGVCDLPQGELLSWVSQSRRRMWRRDASRKRKPRLRGCPSGTSQTLDN
jgi:hypothetical protein